MNERAWQLVKSGRRARALLGHRLSGRAARAGDGRSGCAAQPGRRGRQPGVLSGAQCLVLPLLALVTLAWLCQLRALEL